VIILVTREPLRNAKPSTCSSPTKNYFHLNPTVYNQNNSVWAGRRKADIKLYQLLVEREKFAPQGPLCHGVSRSVR